MIILYNIYNILFLILSIAVFSATGRLLIRKTVLFGENPRSLRFLFSFSVGFIVYSLIITLLTFLHTLYFWTVLTVYLLGAIIAIKQFDPSVLKFSFSKTIKLSKTELVSLFVVAFSLTLGLSGSILPPIARDTLKYHFFIPSVYLSHHGITTIPDNIYSGFPQYGEAIYTFALAIGNEIIAKLYHFLFGALSVLLLYSAARKHSDRATAAVSAAILASTPLFIELSGWGYIDLTLTFFTLLSVCLLLELTQTHSKSTLYIWAMASGFAMGIKYTFLISFTMFGLFIFCYFILSKKNTLKTRNIITAFVIAMAIASVWYIKNIVYTGNPVFPFFYHILGGINWDIERADLFKKMLFDIYGAEKTLKGLLLTPYLLAVSKTTGAWTFDGIIGPAYLIAALICLFSLKGTTKKETALYTFCGLFFISWFTSSQQSRFLMPMLAVFLLAHSITQERFRTDYRQISRFLNICLFIIMLSNFRFPVNELVKLKSYKYLSGKIDKTAFLEGNLQNYRIIDYINHNLPDNAKILFIHVGNIGFYCQRAFIQDSVFEEHTFVKLVKSNKSPSEILKAFRKDSITHLLIDEERAEEFSKYSFTESDILKYSQFKKTHLMQLKKDHTVALYKIK